MILSTIQIIFIMKLLLTSTRQGILQRRRRMEDDHAHRSTRILTPTRAPQRKLRDIYLPSLILYMYEFIREDRGKERAGTTPTSMPRIPDHKDHT